MTLVALLWACLSACSGGEATTAPAGPPATVPVVVLAVAPEVLERAVEAAGTVEAEHSVEVRPEAAGQAVEVLFDDGAHVEKGQVLVRLRDADARAGVDEARARLELAALELARAKDLRARETVSQAELDRAVAGHALAGAAVARAEEALRRTRIVAPFAGVAGRREVSPGAVLDPSRAVTRVEALDRLVVDVALSESTLAGIAEGQAASVRVEALPGETFPGVVAFVAPRVDAQTRTVGVRVALANPGERLRPGMTAALRIVTDTVPGALLVPTEAMVNSARGGAVYVVGEDGKATLRPVRTGLRTADRVEITEGLAAGDRVVVEGLARLRPGAAVTVKGAPEAAK